MLFDKLKGTRDEIERGTTSFLCMTLHRKTQKLGVGFQTRLKVQLKERKDSPKQVMKVTVTVMDYPLGRDGPQPA